FAPAVQLNVSVLLIVLPPESVHRSATKRVVKVVLVFAVIVIWLRLSPTLPPNGAVVPRAEVVQMFWPVPTDTLPELAVLSVARPVICALADPCPITKAKAVTATAANTRRPENVLMANLH